MTGAHRDNHFPRIGQLIHQGLGNPGSGGGDDDRVVWAVLRPAQGPVIELAQHVQVVEVVKGAAGSDKEGLDPLHGIDLGAEHGEDGGLIAAAGTDFQDGVFLAQAQGLGHEGNDIGLGDCLSFADGQGEISIGLAAQGVFDKEVPGDGLHGVDNGRVGDPPGDELFPDQPRPGGFVIIYHPACCPLCRSFETPLPLTTCMCSF